MGRASYIFINKNRMLRESGFFGQRNHGASAANLGTSSASKSGMHFIGAYWLRWAKGFDVIMPVHPQFL
jgi:hypothetical protein